MRNTENFPLISVIVPVYNVKDYLERCLQSICGQTYRNLEILLIDDGSSDGSGELCDLFARKDARVKVVHQKNAGQSAARNRGLEMAQGEYLGFVDSDDWIEPDMYAFLYRLLAKNDADISICSHYMETGVKTRVKHSSGRSTVFSREEAIRTLVRDKRIRNYMWDKLFKRSVFEGIRFPVNRIYEDIVVSYQLFYKARKVVMRDCPKYHYLKREGSTTQSKWYNYETEYQFFRAVCEQVEFVREKNIWDKASYCVLERGVHLVDHLMMLPSSSETDAVISDVLIRMREAGKVSWPQLGVADMAKCYLIYNHLEGYRTAYRLVRRFFKSKRYQFLQSRYIEYVCYESSKGHRVLSAPVSSYTGK